ncbi:hypothetical protein K2173_026676 [Erythroxylum novogranatense]|uniref:TPX2 central domain-containing protein n=1 Tax=Erythroxylum novogranatense TaxID=1862640 RepID=A0AAV8TZL6_9ROSI|nr:hypothetical protein K2173_026676 [Erythroxylum novogranatense]
MEEFFDETFCFEEIDFDYEFDAPKFFDFARTETDSEAGEAELWFQNAGNYPPSHWNWGLDLHFESASNHNPDMDTAGCEPCIYTTKQSRGLESCNHMDEDHQRVKPKSPLSEDSRFMSPTANQLARQNHTSEFRCPRLLRGSFAHGATKRQKLESGYLCKVSRLKHQAQFVHKAPQKTLVQDQQVDPNPAPVGARPKVTIPREPNLETAYRAKLHRMKLRSAENQKQKARTFKARPLNKKILRAPSMPRCRKSTPQMPEFQEFHLRTSERAMQHVFVNASTIPNLNPGSLNKISDSQRVNSVSKEKFEVRDKIRTRCLGKKELNCPATKVYPEPEDLPIELFNKLSLTSEVHTKSKFRVFSEGSKENTPGSLTLMKEITSIAKLERRAPNRRQCGDDWRIPPQMNVNRSLALR